MDRQTATAEDDMTELEERIDTERERTALMREQLRCECPDSSCPVAHES